MFKTKILRLSNDDRQFYQWDTERKLIVNDNTCDKVYFSNDGMEMALTCNIYEVDGVRMVNVPNIILQDAKPLKVHLSMVDNDGRLTTYYEAFHVAPRKKPNGYVYTETEVLNYAYLDERLKELEGEGLANAVADYLEKNHPQAGATEEESAQIQQNKADIETLSREKLDASELPEAVNDALTQAKASGEFKGEPGNDGKTPVKGVDYFTEADKQEIAEQAAELVEVPEDTDAVESVNGKTGAVELTHEDVGAQLKTLVVTLTENADGTFTAGHSPAEIEAHVNACGDSTINIDGVIYRSLGGNGVEWVYGITTYNTGIELQAIGIMSDKTTMSLNYNVKDDIPKTLPNPNALTFTGAVTGTYDGSKPVEIEVPVIAGEPGKDGITPHIGDNGNWWIGDTDTGVSAGGSGSGSSGGSVIPFANVKATKIVDLSIPTDEEGKLPTRIEITQRDDGTPLNLKAFVIQSDISSGVSYTEITFNGNPWRTAYFVPHGRKETASTFIIGADGGMFQSGNSVTAGYHPIESYVAHDKNLKYETIEKISYPSSGQMMAKGTFIWIWELTAEVD